MPKKNIGFNATEEETELFEKNRDEAGFASNADFIKARCLNLVPSAQVRPGKPDDQVELENAEERRRRLRISNVILKNLPISSLGPEELKHYVLVLDAILKTHKVDALTHNRTASIIKEFEPQYTVVQDAPALPEKPNLLWCFEAKCETKFDVGFNESRRKHMREVHGWTVDQLIAVGDL